MAKSNQNYLNDFYEEVFNRGDVDAADRFFESSLVDHAPWPGHPATPAGFKSGLEEMRTGFPDLSIAAERIISQDDFVVGHIKISGTHLGEFIGTPGSGKTFSIEAVDIVRMNNGRIAEHWGVLDAAGMAEQLGLAP